MYDNRISFYNYIHISLSSFLNITAVMLLQLYVTLGAMWTGMSFEGQAAIEILLFRLSFKRSQANPCPLLSVRLTNAADFFLE